MVHKWIEGMHRYLKTEMDDVITGTEVPIMNFGTMSLNRNI
jgi:hypothetical protein